MQASTFGIKSNVLVQLFDANGAIKETREIHNAVTDAGIYGVMDQILAAPSLPKMGWMEVGTGSVATAGHLQTYISGSRVAFTSKVRGLKVVTVVGDFAAGVGTGAITEAGTFDVVTQNTANCWMYATFTAINKQAADTLKITWTLTGA